jgi:hypothetical protein
MAELDRDQPMYDVQTLEDALVDSVAPRRFRAVCAERFCHHGPRNLHPVVRSPISPCVGQPNMP